MTEENLRNGLVARTIRHTINHVEEILKDLKTNPNYYTFGSPQQLRKAEQELLKAANTINSSLAGFYDERGIFVIKEERNL